ncbi:ABC transporter permease [Halobellus clavatus]|uniref:ABC-type Na+ efflux pump, permease component n=1 Tax=Halobellus clavatus TaxID=660517 RepID=A0A1H3GYL0_9EURY|nr:ABC transporter permease [Halobellus clavatus]SDY08207.1 ABC-type Na+ efflux pump, permease component [Halobellus clavatus]
MADRTDPRLTIARRELGSLRKEKTIVLALVLQLFIAAFSSFLVVGLVSLYDPGQVQGTEVDIAVTGDASEDLIRAASEVRGVDAQYYRSEETALRAFHEYRGTGIDAVLVAETRDERVFVRAVAPDGNVQTTVVVVQLREVLRSFEDLKRTQRAAYLDSLPLELPPETSSSPYFGFTYTVLLPLLLFLPVFISGSISVDALTEEIDRGTLELLRVAPVSMTDVVDGKLLAAAGLAPAQAALWVLLLELNGTSVSNVPALLVLVAAMALLVCSVGAAVALLAPERRAAQLLYSLGVLLVFGGTAVFPNGPINAAARLAIGSASGIEYAAVGAVVIASLAAYLGLRGIVGRVDPDAL